MYIITLAGGVALARAFFVFPVPFKIKKSGNLECCAYAVARIGAYAETASDHISSSTVR